jgi:nitroreductase
MNVIDAVRQRISTRAFLPDPISRADIASLLEDAQRSPSGGNVQPWRTIAVTGPALQEIIAIAAQTLANDPMAVVPQDRPVYPPELANMAPYYEKRRREVGDMMYKQLGIPKEDRPARLAWFANNYRFFGAPVGLFFILDKRHGHGQWAHTGMYMQTIALLAEERGWGTCMQECWARLRVELHAYFGLPETDMLYCGMALGKPDRSHPVNALYTNRAPQDEVAEFRGF